MRLSAVSAVTAEFHRLDPTGSRTAQVLRRTFDQLYDGERTGRYRWDQLSRVEKNGCGPLIEINLHREFEFADGTLLDYAIASVDVDCKCSQKIGGWMIPPEARGRLCLVLSAEDSALPRWSLGVVRVTSERLNTGANRDAKATLNKIGRAAITWLFRDSVLPANILLQLDRATVDRIFSQRSGQLRVNELFRSALCKVIGRAAVATVAQQEDYMKRVRANGGARTALQPEGILILGQFTSHAAIAQALRIPIPGAGDSISVRVAPASSKSPGVAMISKGFWRVAKTSDRVVRAPELPTI